MFVADLSVEPVEFYSYEDLAGMERDAEGDAEPRVLTTEQVSGRHNSATNCSETSTSICCTSKDVTICIDVT